MNDSIGIVAGIITFVVMVLVYVWSSLALAAVFRKAGEDAWQAWVPVLNTAVLLRLGGFSPWFVFIAFVPLFGWIALLVMLVISYSRINRAFGHGTGMTVLAVLLPLIWASILGFGSSRWIGAEPAGPSRSREGYQLPDAASRPLVGAFPAFDQGVGSSAPATVAAAAPAPVSPATPPTAPVSSSTAAGFWAPPPPAPSSAAPSPAAFPPPSQIVVPQSAPAAPPLPPPPPVSFTGPSTTSSPLPDGLEDSAVDPEDRIAPAAPLSGSFLPPPPARETAPPRRSAEPFAPIESVPVIASPPPAEVAASAPVIEVPAPSAPAEPEPEPWAPAPLRTPPPASNDPEHFPELSEAVSAVAGAPDAGAPRSARSSVSALYAQPEIPDDDDDDDIEAMDQTIVARRRRVPWTLIPPGGSPVDISSEVVILGRRPSADPAHPGAQLISISDETRTVSKTHARLELRGDTWFVTDLGSTNGVLFATLMGTEVEAQPGQELEAGERFFLGDAEVRLKRSDA
jgi:hypothetical protein